MKEKIKEALLDIYSEEILGGFDLFKISMPLIEEVYCELNKWNVEWLRQKKEEIKWVVFADIHPHNHPDFSLRYDYYIKLLRDLLEEE